MKQLTLIFLASFVSALTVTPLVAQTPTAGSTATGGSSGGSATIGSGGSAAAGGTSASTAGVGAASGDARSLSTGGSAAAVEGKATSRTKINENKNDMMGRSSARAQDGGTWSRSTTRTKIHKGELTTRTKTMAHEPGGPPVKSTSGTSADQTR